MLWFWGDAVNWGIWIGYWLCNGEESLSDPPLSSQEWVVWLTDLYGLVVYPVFWWRVFPPRDFWLWEPVPKPSVAGYQHEAVKFIGGPDGCLAFLPGLYMWSWLVWPGVVLCFWITFAFLGHLWYSNPVPLLMSERNDTCRNIWHMLSSIIPLYMKPVLMKYSMSRYSFVHWS